MYPMFTRYLYDVSQVKYSLMCAILEKEREEALYWAYELYHSGFEQEVWFWIRDLYVEHYRQSNPAILPHFDRFYHEWKQDKTAHCPLGTVVGTMAMLDSGEEDSRKSKRFILLYNDTRHETKPVVDRAWRYLNQVCIYPVRVQKWTEEKSKKLREAYLGPNWLYYCAETPIWISRIQKHRGSVSEDKNEIVFQTDDDLEEFYERWGFEPDEQSTEMHAFHGIYFASSSEEDHMNDETCSAT